VGVEDTTRAVREIILLVLGAVGFLHELVIAQAERPVVLGLVAAFLGVQAVGGRRNGSRPPT